MCVYAWLMRNYVQIHLIEENKKDKPNALLNLYYILTHFQQYMHNHVDVVVASMVAFL